MNARSIEMGMFYKVPILVASSFSDAPALSFTKERT